MDWQPQDEPLRQLACCLRDSLNGQNPALRKQAEEVSHHFFFHFPLCSFPSLLQDEKEELED